MQCGSYLSQCLSGIFPSGDAHGIHGGFGSGYADNLEGASSSWDDVLKALTQARSAFGSGLYPGTSPSPKGLKMIIFLPQSVVRD